jgi:PIN domain nuclease of toxin-antitoxin system
MTHFLWVAQKQRELEHKKQLEEMEARVEARLSLFEQAQISSAKAKAKAEFQTILEKAGLSLTDF